MGAIKAVKVSDKRQIAAVEALAQVIWREYYTPLIGKPQVEYMLNKFQTQEVISDQIEKEGYLYYLLEDKNKKPVGYVGVVARDQELFLSKLYVSAEDRGKGYGRYAVELAQMLAREQGLAKISLTVNKRNANSINIYKKLGFVISDPLVTDIGNGFIMDDYRMEKAI